MKAVLTVPAGVALDVALRWALERIGGGDPRELLLDNLQSSYEAMEEKRASEENRRPEPFPREVYEGSRRFHFEDASAPGFRLSVEYEE